MYAPGVPSGQPPYIGHHPPPLIIRKDGVKQYHVTKLQIRQSKVIRFYKRLIFLKLREEEKRKWIRNMLDPRFVEERGNKPWLKEWDGRKFIWMDPKTLEPCSEPGYEYWSTNSFYGPEARVREFKEIEDGLVGAGHFGCLKDSSKLPKGSK